MGDQNAQFEVRRISAKSPDYHSALHLVFDVEPPRAGNVAPAVAEMLAGARRLSKRPELVFGAYDDDRLISACLALESPGAAALVYSPRKQRAVRKAQATVAALAALRQAAKVRSIRLLEVLLEPGSSEAAQSLRRAGFVHITQLLYLQRRVGRLRNPPDTDAGLEWVAYSSKLIPLFCAGLEATYVQSLDCPELTGLRSTLDVLAGHRATGIFDPALWWVVRRAAAPVGVLLLNRVARQPALEIVYLGVAQPARGTGVADALVGRAVAVAERLGVSVLTLAVDVRNTPARRMYARWRFEPRAVRGAWIATSPRARP